ncbi:hypothetical protein [Nocardiopsis algeriensis]|uniref:Small-conductance mechanosensitive channel n=1 Tax=Nocardiopsis algeriensis TaxID=1478215 RepID=A0A841IXC8_9ACTN|nr:hypothetical protein [Nocardiopsis algeriensis]MBB6121926.1 small-conductance mechanosensitive channel [Nocardiopsis algeriensis]
MTGVNFLVNIALFGIVGAVMAAALIGLLLVLSGRSKEAPAGLRVGFAAVSVLLLVAVPALAAAATLSGGGGFWAGFATAACVAAAVLAVNVLMLPMVARRQAAVSGGGVPAAPRPSLPVLAVGLLLCLLLGLLCAGAAALVV